MATQLLFLPQIAFASGVFAPGARARFFLSGTTTPVTVYLDTGYSTAAPSPLVADATGRFPQVFYNGPDDVRCTITTATDASIADIDPVIMANGVGETGFWVDDVAALLISDLSEAVEGDYVRTRAEGFAYEVAASDATDEHVTTAGGVKLYVLTPAVMAFGAAGDGATNDATLLDAARSAFPSDHIDLGGRSYVYTGNLPADSRDEFFNGTVAATNGTFVFRAPTLGDFRKSGAVADPNLVDNSRFNRTHASLVASTILSGTELEPNRVGQQYHVQYFTGDGTTDGFAVTAPFTIADLSPARTITATGVRASDGVPLIYTISGVSGYGTNTLTMTVQFAGAPPPSGSMIEIVVFADADDASAVPTLIQTNGYDNAVNPIMSAALSAHGLIGNGGGHNLIASGSYGRVFGSYSAVLSGQGNYLGSRNAGGTVGTVASGRGIRIDGTDCYAAGLGHDGQGNFSSYFGQQNLNTGLELVTMTGRRGRAYSVGERVHAGGKSTDTEWGQYQVRELILGGNTTNDTVTGLTNANNGTTQAMPDNSSALLHVEVVAMRDDGTKMESFAGDFLLTVVAGIALVNNSPSDVAIPSVSSIGTPGYLANARAIAGGLQIRVQGAASENVRWAATARLTQTRWP